MIKITTILILMCLSPSSFSNELDKEIGRYIEMFNLATPKKIPTTDMKKYRFGEKLFSDNQLSLSNNISCKSCHGQEFGSSDSLPFSIGTGGEGAGANRVQAGAGITPRSSPHLFNKGHHSVKTMFWDGRVRFSSRDNAYVTPEPGLNGKSPKLSYITDVIENVMAMQAIFPMVNPTEMLGTKLSSLSNEKIWNRIAKRIVLDPEYSEFIADKNKFNIAHIANALSYFQTRRFQVTDTPYDRYIRGEFSALSKIEKDGAMVFLDNGRCVRCHNGALLSNNAFQGVATPQIGPGLTEEKDDLGLYHALGENRAKYLFKTQPLRNIALTAPFMHNGSFVNLEEVVDHYDSPQSSLDSYTVDSVQREFTQNYSLPIFHDSNLERNERRKAAIAPVIRGNLNLSLKEKKSLICFLKKSLTETKLHSSLNLAKCQE